MKDYGLETSSDKKIREIKHRIYKYKLNIHLFTILETTLRSLTACRKLYAVETFPSASLVTTS